MRQRCEPGTIRVAPFSGVKSSSIHTELHTQYPDSSAIAALSACSGWSHGLCGSADRTFRLLSLNFGPSTCAIASSTSGVRITSSNTRPLFTRFASRRAPGSCLNSEPGQGAFLLE